MYTITKSIDIDFAHHVHGHMGACVNIHGHTWKFEVTLGAKELDDMGFVVDFGDLKREVLAPVHLLLDHSLALPKLTLYDTPGFREHLEEIGCLLTETRGKAAVPLHDAATNTEQYLGYKVYGAAPDGKLWVDNAGHVQLGELNEARNDIVGGIKVAAFPFNPTSERLAEWLHGVAMRHLANDRVQVVRASIYETLHPVEAVATYEPVIKFW